ncbi:MAG: PEP-CTERM sorting domain-containing protein [Spirulinaceae cyanobacterium RM2_2_10]|nr:PEP-CTERM sorting domain-containing protein [Spirulinaceae cyanobacterium RM2_2_10]
MKFANLGKISVSTAAVACAFAVAAPQAEAGVLHNGWNYSIDSFSDGSGGEVYDYKGLAAYDAGDQFIFAISGGLNFDENSGRNLTHGDLFLNFSGEDFDVANGSSSMLAIKFAPNDTDFETGLYTGVTGGDINDFANINHTGHYSSLKNYYNKGFDKENTYGTDLATSDAVYDYFYSDAVAANPKDGNTPFMSAMQSGTKIGDVSMLTKSVLNSQYGLDFAHFDAVGSDVFGIAIDKALLGTVLPGGINGFMAHLILECGNDGVALAGALEIPTEEEVPEPTALAALALVGVGMLGARKRR